MKIEKRYHLFLLFFISSFLLAVESSGTTYQKEEIVDLFVINKEGDVILSKSGLVIDTDGIIVTSTIVIEKWLENVQNRLTVKIKDRSYQISKLIYFNKKQDTAVFSINDKEVKRDVIQQIIKKADVIKRILRRDIRFSNSLKKDEVKKEIVYLPQKRDPSDLLKEALGFYKEGKYLDAIEIYERLSEQNPTSEIYNRLGVLYIITNNYSKAIDALEKARNIDPQDAETYFNLGLSYYLKGNKEFEVFEYYLILKRLNSEKAEELFEFVYR